MKRYAVVVCVCALVWGFGCAKKVERAEETPGSAPAVESTAKATHAEMAPGFALKDLQGNTVTLSSYKGTQPVLLMFWTTWCPFCRMGLKNVSGRAAQLKDADLAFIAVDTGEDLAKVKDFIEKNKYTFTVVLDEDGMVSSHYHLIGVPTYVLIGKDGGILTSQNEFPADFKELIGVPASPATNEKK